MRIFPENYGRFEKHQFIVRVYDIINRITSVCTADTDPQNGRANVNTRVEKTYFENKYRKSQYYTCWYKKKQIDRVTRRQNNTNRGRIRLKISDISFRRTARVQNQLDFERTSYVLISIRFTLFSTQHPPGLTIIMFICLLIKNVIATNKQCVPKNDYALENADNSTYSHTTLMPRCSTNVLVIYLKSVYTFERNTLYYVWKHWSFKRYRLKARRRNWLLKSFVVVMEKINCTQYGNGH